MAMSAARHEVKIPTRAMLMTVSTRSEDRLNCS
jgi:hypothetical protein